MGQDHFLHGSLPTQVRQLISQLLNELKYVHYQLLHTKIQYLQISNHALALKEHVHLEFFELANLLFASDEQ